MPGRDELPPLMPVCPWGGQVDYRDGSQEDVWMPLERVRVCMQAQEALDPPSAHMLAMWGAALQAAASSQQDEAAVSAGVATLATHAGGLHPVNLTQPHATSELLTMTMVQAGHGRLGCGLGLNETLGTFMAWRFEPCQVSAWLDQDGDRLLLHQCSGAGHSSNLGLPQLQCSRGALGTVPCAPCTLPVMQMRAGDKAVIIAQFEHG